jgi:hypothetical protein
VTFASSRSLLGRGDLRGTLRHQSNTLRGARAGLSSRLGFLSIQWWEKGGWSGWALGKWTAKGEWGKVLDIIGKVTGAGQPATHVIFLWPFIEGNHVCIVLVFLNIPAFQITENKTPTQKY